MEYHTAVQRDPPRLKGMGVTEASEEEVQRVFEALDSVEAMDDPVARARAVSLLLRDQSQRNKRLKNLRDQAVRDLRSEGKSLGAIAAQMHVSRGTVQDILRGHTGTWASRPPAKPADEETGAPEPRTDTQRKQDGSRDDASTSGDGQER